MRAEHLYVHVPFCARRCVYCDFSIAVRARVPVDEYLQALDREFRIRHRTSHFELDTVYLGGGTPSKLGADGVRRLMDLVRDRASLKLGAEVTIEANPEDVSAPAVRAWLAAGVNRVSLGVQSFDDAVLAWMHRTHDAKGAESAIHVLREQGLSNFSIDLIFASPADLSRRWDRDLDIAIALDLPHVSVYGLTIEPHTPLGRQVARRARTEAPEEAFELEFLLADARLTASGLMHYEVSNYGRPGQDSQHNWAYWTRRPYAGLGPSAHEFDGSRRRWNSSPYVEWVGRLSKDEDPTAGTEVLTSDQEVAEAIYLGLRTTAGVPIAPSEALAVQKWTEAGWASVGSEDRLRLTPSGWLRLDSLASDLTMLRSR